MAKLIWKFLIRFRDIDWKCNAAQKHIVEISRLKHNLTSAKTEAEKTNIISTINLKVLKLRAIKKELERWNKKWNKKHPNNDSTIMQPAEVSIGMIDDLIDDLRKKGLLNGK
ncbi:hypothetical protein FACS1894102_6160 [Spirochaetia bacterium]|nr:hypothetical protein FACS1894102_6160 [Spirochaetia bacterium]